MQCSGKCQRGKKKKKKTKQGKRDARGDGGALSVQTRWSGKAFVMKFYLYKALKEDRTQVFYFLKSVLFITQEEKEELLQYKSTVASLMGRAKTIIQLKPRNPDCPLKTSLPIKAICDYRQIEVFQKQTGFWQYSYLLNMR